jgi:hypothetical protein
MIIDWLQGGLITSHLELHFFGRRKVFARDA